MTIVIDYATFEGFTIEDGYDPLCTETIVILHPGYPGPSPEQIAKQVANHTLFKNTRRQRSTSA